MKPLKYRKFKRRFIGERLRHAIKQNNYTFNELADRIGVTPANISALANGASDPCVDTLWCIAKELGVSTDWLLGLTDFPYPVFCNNKNSGKTNKENITSET